MPPAVPPAFARAGRAPAGALVAALTGGSRAGSPAAHGWCRAAVAAAGSQPMPAALWGPGSGAARPDRRVRYRWWAVEDLNL